MLNVSLERVFPFFENPQNLALITPPSLRFRLLSPSPVTMQQGRVIDYRIRLGVLPVRWRSLISTYDPPSCFVDEQLEGPYAYWRHTHRFECHAQRTLMMDEVEYALPSGLPALLERLMHASYVRPSLDAIFDYRASFYADFFGDGHESRVLTLPGAAPELRA